MLKKSYNKFYIINLWLNYINKKQNSIIRMNLIPLKFILSKLNLLYWESDIITISGTNGKGSVLSCISNISKYYNINTGEYSSPHVLLFNERIKYNRQYISNTSLIKIYLYLSKKTKYYFKSYFDFITMSAFLFFKKKSVEMIILEVGLGGRLDSTNVIKSNTNYYKIGIIVSISIDHVEYLGYSIKKILYEKLGILNGNTYGLIGVSNIPLFFCQYLVNKNINLSFYGLQFNYSISKNYIYFFLNRNIYKFFNRININKHSLCCALYIFIILKKNILLIKKIDHIYILGRWECILRKPYFFLDTAHNLSAINKLNKKINKKNKESIIIFLILSNKFFTPMQNIFNKKGYIWMLTNLKNKKFYTNHSIINSKFLNKEILFWFSKTNYLIKISNKITRNTTNIFCLGSFHLIEKILKLKILN